MSASREVTYDVDGLTMVAHLALPPGVGPWAAVLIGHDGIGLDDYQRRRADDLAARGYAALAMDYHGGELFFGRPEAMLARVMPLLADPERMRTIGSAALDVLRAVPGVDPDRVAALGYGAGGRIVLELARAGVAFKAVAAVHPGLLGISTTDWTDVTGAVLLCTGSEDPICTPEQVLTFGRALQDAGVDWRVNVYGGAEHAFWAEPTNPDGSPTGGSTHTMATVPGVGYHPSHTPRAWRAVLELFDEALVESSARQ
ncbi:dienelactone hydrolase [Mycolicibacterium sp. BK556]|uniref:dienelactone hydrolase family protein n=1 Tax=Mycobacteriaceae TaxID=1762 RepID=UPI00105B5599|nr:MULTISPECIES: dienelactone hydrolase family protein [Mycobacteriaceae]MBB3603793.1 dienelactone hydrolase [Mycolicibacterium sp. BK556]MBB3633988.1 dienelactone hydrolase [Mycolicibacterium sp. BK607]MBB3751570.1 dienelactone hydrolase [Mycolicibacterium sp. BK634]TDO12087.1 dienelactone hydrolase [Mycobacterium sp. BK086]